MGTQKDAFDLLLEAYKAGLAAGRWTSKSGFAGYLGVAQATASAWLRRKKRPDLTHSFELGPKLGIDPKLWPQARLDYQKRAA